MLKEEMVTDKDYNLISFEHTMNSARSYQTPTTNTTGKRNVNLTEKG